MNAFSAMTFNIRYDTDEDGDRAWPNRRSLALATIREHDPDLLGLQEAMDSQHRDIARALPGWTGYGFDPENDYPGCFIRTSRFELKQNDLFWLSDTPHTPERVTWPNDWGPRRCCWGRLHDRRAHRDLIFASTHFDTNAESWLRSAAVLNAELDKIAGTLPIVLTGDFNCAAGSIAHHFLCDDAGFRDAWTEAGQPDERVVTFNGFTPFATVPSNAGTNYRIDWILLRGPLACVSALIDDRNENGALPSDHYPVIARIEWKE